MDFPARITGDPAVMTGRSCIRGMRVTVANVLRLLAAGHSRERILAAYPYLEKEDIDACLHYAALRFDEQELTLDPRVRLLIDMNLSPEWARLAALIRMGSSALQQHPAASNLQVRPIRRIRHLPRLENPRKVTG